MYTPFARFRCGIQDQQHAFEILYFLPNQVTAPETAIMTIEFDAIDYAQQLEAAGVPRNQADVHAKALTGVVREVVSESDLLQTKNDLQRDLRHTEDRLTSRIDLAKTELSTKVETFRAEFNTKIELLDGKIDKSSTELDGKIDGFKVGLESKIDGLKADLNAKIDGFKVELDAKIDRLGATQDSIKNELGQHRWAFALFFSMLGSIFIKTFWP